MKIRKLVLTATAFMLLTMFMISAVEGVDNIDHTDPTGDVENESMPSDAVKNVDIKSLSMEISGEDVILEMTVDGSVAYNDTSLTYFYYIFLDQEGDGSESVSITVSSGSAMYMSDYGSTFGFSLPLYGDGTDTLRVVLTTTSIDTANHPVQDIYGFTEVSDLSTGWAEDYINEDFGVVPGDDDDDDDDDDINPDDFYATDKEYKNSEDPKEETPTDPTLEIDIDSFDYSWEQNGDREEWEETTDGTADEDVIHAAVAKVFYYYNGTHNDIEWLMGAYNMPRMTISDATHESHFKGMGPAGKDDWIDWEMYFYGEREMDPLDPAGLKEACVDIDEVESAVIYVRVFSDEDLTVWNQDSEDVTDDYFDPNIINAGDDDDDDDDDDDGTPGFELVLIIPMVLIMVGLTYHFKRRRD